MYLKNKNIGELHLSGTGLSPEDTLSKTKLVLEAYKKPGQEDDPSAPVYTRNATKYKYVFSCNDQNITYNTVTGRISSMYFKGKYDEESWDPH